MALAPAHSCRLFRAFSLFPPLEKYRRTRNRVVSIVLHLCVMILCISLLAGISFRYEIPNTKNEVLLLVDSSFSSQEAQQKKTNLFDLQ